MGDVMIKLPIISSTAGENVDVLGGQRQRYRKVRSGAEQAGPIASIVVADVQKLPAQSNGRTQNRGKQTRDASDRHASKCRNHQAIPIVLRRRAQGEVAEPTYPASDEALEDAVQDYAQEVIG
jgi:hypothetical protein